MMPSSAAGPKKVTLPTLQVLDLFVADPTRDDWYALELCRQTGLGSGTMSQILFRLQQWGWVEDRWEDAADAHARRRPPRRFYRLTGLGERGARQLLVRRLPGRLTWGTQG
jgi:hypothetical protein